jgi:hypothetical protein
LAPKQLTSIEILKSMDDATQEEFDEDMLPTTAAYYNKVHLSRKQDNH